MREAILNNLRKLRHLGTRPWFAYVTLFLLQLKIIWGIWKYRDLTPGDTSAYFSLAYPWFERGGVHFAWSPLYTAFYGSMLHVSTDAYTATILHRVIIIFAVTLMALCLMRKLLPPFIAWVVAAWWTVLPITFNCLYEVHLFAVIPVLAAWILIGSKNSPWTRGGAIAVLFVESVLVRNEYCVATATLAAVCLAWELYDARIKGSSLGARLRGCLPGYGAPMLVALALCGFFYERSDVKFPYLNGAMEGKHTVNMAQVYAFGYQQRHPEWKGSPWTDCGKLMQRDFGSPLVSLAEMIKRNPKATFEHMLWNIGLTPSGLQVLLFDSTSGSVDPDYAPVALHSTLAGILSIGTGAILILGLRLLYRDRSYWWRSWLKARMFYWLAMLSVATVAVPVILTQRPRPSYLFTLGIFLMALVGMCAFAIWRRFTPLGRLRMAGPAVMLFSPLVIPSYCYERVDGVYESARRAESRPLLTRYRRLVPFEEYINLPGTKLLGDGFDFEIANYITHDDNRVSGGVNYSIFEKRPASMLMDKYLEQEKINLFYVAGGSWSTFEMNPSDRKFLDQPETAGWEKIAVNRYPEDRWMLLRKKVAFEEDAILLRGLNNYRDIVPTDGAKRLHKSGEMPVDGIFLGRSWYGLERARYGTFRWVNNDAEIVVTKPSGLKKRLVLDVEPGPALGATALKLDLVDSGGNSVAKSEISHRMNVSLDLPAISQRSFTVHLHVEEGGLKSPAEGESRILNFRVFGVRWE